MLCQFVISVYSCWMRKTWPHFKHQCGDCERTGIKSIRFLKQFIDELVGELNFDQIHFINNSNHMKELWIWLSMITADSREWNEEENCILSFKTPQLNSLETASKKGSVCDLCESDQCTSSIWSNVIKMDCFFFGMDISPKGSWWSLYKCPIGKRTGDLQWRIVHGVVAMNRHVADLNPNVGVDCLFWTEN